MLTFIIILLIGIVIGFVLSRASFVKDGGVLSESVGGSEKGGDVEEKMSTKEKREDVGQKILDLIEEKGRVTNNDIEKLLNVADSTATKYLQRLEDEGKIKQEGETGRFVYYTKK